MAIRRVFPFVLRSFPLGTALLNTLLLVAATSPAIASSLYSGTLEVQFHDCPVTQAASGPLLGTCSSTNGTGEALANYTTLGVTGETNFETAWSDQADMYDTITVGGVAAGTIVDLTFSLGYGGDYNFSSGGATGEDTVGTTVILTYNGDTVVDDADGLRLCDVAFGPGCDYYGSTIELSVGRVLITSPIPEVAGIGVPISLEFALFEDGPGKVYGQFLDPLSFTNIAVTDPTTGLPIPGAIVMGESGTVYPTNMASVPDPSTAALVGVACSCWRTHCASAAHF